MLLRFRESETKESECFDASPSNNKLLRFRIHVPLCPSAGVPPAIIVKVDG